MMRTINKVVISVAFILFSQITRLNAQTILSGGPLTGTLTVTSSPYHVTGSVTVPYGGVLTIQPGVVMKFDNHSYMDVLGQLLVNGTSAQPVLFTSYDTTGFSNYADTTGGWHGIRILPSATTDTSVINNAIFEYSKSIGNDNRGSALTINLHNNVIVDSCEFRFCITHFFGSAILLMDASPWISHCNIHNNRAEPSPNTVNGGAIGMMNSSAHIEYCTIAYDTSYEGGAFNISGPSTAFIGWCDISYNFAYLGMGGGIAINMASPTLYHNKIDHNTAYNGGGGISVKTSANPDIDGNLICNNFSETCGCGATDGGGAIRVDGGTNSPMYSCNPLIRNNVMSNNHTLDNGGGIKLFFTNARIFNNDIAYNYAGGDGGGIYTWGSGSTTFSATIQNNIITANHCNNTVYPEQVYVGQYFYPSLYNNIIDSGQAGVRAVPFYNTYPCDSTNFAANPQWYSPPGGYGPAFDGTLACWLIPLSSPAHNAGNPDSTNSYISTYDYANNIRFMESRLDIGAVEVYPLIAGVNAYEANTGLTVFPVPASDVLNVAIGDNNENVMLTVTDMLGQTVLTKSCDVNSSTGTTALDVSSLLPGTYFLTVNGNNLLRSTAFVVSE